jgi:hypothetical protein
MQTVRQLVGSLALNKWNNIHFHKFDINNGKFFIIYFIDMLYVLYYITVLGRSFMASRDHFLCDRELVCSIPLLDYANSCFSSCPTYKSGSYLCLSFHPIGHMWLFWGFHASKIISPLFSLLWIIFNTSLIYTG